MFHLKVKLTFILLLIMICIYTFIHDSGVSEQTIRYEFVDVNSNDENVDSHTRLARAIHLTVLGHKPKTFPICSLNNPCGWELYRTPGRHIYGFLYNGCKCHPNTTCVRHSDDLSMYTYIYRCHVNVTDTDKLAPPDDIVEDGVVAWGNI